MPSSRVLRNPLSSEYIKAFPGVMSLTLKSILSEFLAGNPSQQEIFPLGQCTPMIGNSSHSRHAWS
jgi:hypothetical protein